MAARPRSDEKIQAILTAAGDCLTEKGYASATIGEIAKRANVSRGLLHYYFENKEDLLTKVVEHNISQTENMMSSLFLACETAEELAANLTSALKAVIESNPALFHLMFECWVVARQSPAIALAVTGLYNKFRYAIGQGLKQAADKGVIRSSLANEEVAAQLTGLLDGLAMQIIIEPKLGKNEQIWPETQRVIQKMIT